jgi:hypothetical protein
MSMHGIEYLKKNGEMYQLLWHICMFLALHIATSMQS